jgi:hypothetical protein
MGRAAQIACSEVPRVLPERADHVFIDLVCIDCFLGDHPRPGRGMELARQHGEAIFTAGKWSAASATKSSADSAGSAESVSFARTRSSALASGRLLELPSSHPTSTCSWSA